MNKFEGVEADEEEENYQELGHGNQEMENSKTMTKNFVSSCFGNPK